MAISRFRKYVLWVTSSHDKCGGIPEYLKDGLNGFFITQNGKDIAEKVNVISSKKELYEQMSANARQTALKHSWNACAQKYLNVIEQ